MQTDVIRRISIQATQQGVVETTDGLKKLSVAQDNVAIASDKQQKAHLSVAQALEKQQRSLDITYRSTQQFEKAQRDLDQAQQQGLLTAQRYAELSALNTARMKDQTSAANDNAEGWRLSGIEIASTANHAKQAAVAAYALSPAFREMVNPAIGAGLRLTGTALAAMGPTAAGVATEVGARLLPALALIARVALPIMLVVDAIRAMAAITELGAQKLKEFNDIAANAGKAGVSTDFFQNAAKGAEELGQKTDAATAALKKFNEVSTPKLGGSELEARLNELVKAGNFVNNSGVAAYKMATDAESRYRAMVDLITQAMDAGQRLAALDLAAKFLPDSLLDKLRANGQVLKEMQIAADAIKPVDIISPEQIGYAIELKRRLTEANDTIEKGLKPIQKDLTQLGLNYQESWVQIVQLEAMAVSGFNTMYGWVKGIADVFTYIGNLSFWTKLTQLTGAMGLNSSPQSMGLILQGQPGFSGNTGAGSAANRSLAGAMYNPTAMFQAMLKANNTQYGPQKDTSINPDDIKKVSDANDAVDRAINTLRRHVEQQKADTEAIGLGAAALARFRAEAAETAAIQANKGKITAEQTADFEKLKVAAFDAADALAKAKVATQIDFANKTKFLSPEDVAIAQQLRASTEAAQLRVINLQKDMADAVKEVGKAAFSSALQGKFGMDQLVSSLDAVAKKLSDKAFDNLTSLDPDKMVIGAVQAGASAVISLFTGDVKAKQELEKAKQAWAAMSMQVVNFNLAAKGFTLGPLTNEIQSLYNSSKQLQDAALKAKDQGGAASAANAFNNAVERIWKEFQTGTQTLTPLQQQMKTLNDEAAGLKDTFDELGFKGRAGTIDSIVQQHIADMTAKFHDTFISGLTTRLNSAKGQGFLNDTANLLLQHSQDLANVKDLGNDPTLLNQVAATFRAEAQKIVDDAALVGTAFTDFTTQFPMLQGVVHEFTQSAVEDSKALRDAQNSAAKSITDYLNNLTAGQGSTQSPIATLASAQTLYQANLPLAQSGNVDAQNKFVSLADNLEKAARSVYASGTVYQDFKNQIINQGLNLPAVQATTDPVTKAVRDAITAIQIGNAALAAANTKIDSTTNAVNASNSIGTLTGTILPAVNAGNAANVAAALSSYFNAIDPTGKLALIVNTNSIAATNSAWLENVAATTVGTKNNLDTLNLLTGTSNSLVAASNNFLTAINTFADRIIQAINSQGNLQANIGNTMNTQLAILLHWQPKLVYGGKGELAATGPDANASFPYTAHAMGGVIPAYGLGLVSEHKDPTFVRAGSEPITVSPFPAQIPFRGSNDNGNSTTLIAVLMKRIDQLEETLSKATIISGNQVTRAIRDTSDDQVEATDENGKRVAYAITAAAKDNKAA
jgi:hypothetical protein